MDKQQVDVYGSGDNTIICVGGCQITLPISLTELEDKIIAEQQRVNLSDVIGKKVSEVQRHYQHICGREEEA